MLTPVRVLDLEISEALASIDPEVGPGEGDYAVFQLHISATPQGKFKVPRRHFPLQTGHSGADIIS